MTLASSDAGRFVVDHRPPDPPIALPVLPLHTAVRLGVVKARSDYQSEVGWPAYVRLVERHAAGADVIVADNSAKRARWSCSASGQAALDLCITGASPARHLATLHGIGWGREPACLCEIAIHGLACRKNPAYDRLRKALQMQGFPISTGITGASRGARLERRCDFRCSLQLLVEPLTARWQPASGSSVKAEAYRVDLSAGSVWQRGCGAVRVRCSGRSAPLWSGGVGSVVVVVVGTPIQLVNEGDQDSLVLIVGAPPTPYPGEYLPDAALPGSIST